VVRDGDGGNARHRGQARWPPGGIFGVGAGRCIQGGEVPVVHAMLEVYRGASDAYIYGPICVDEIERGQGVANNMFASLLAQLPGREGVLFIRCDNAASLRAHARMGMREVAKFDHNGTLFVVLSYVG
jgi:hypothetical protein